MLLDVYRFTTSTKSSFISLLTSVKDRLFVPHRIATEFARNRSAIIREHLAPQRIIKGKLAEATKELKAKHAKFGHVNHLLDLVTRMEEMLRMDYDGSEHRQQKLLQEDTILNELLAVVNDNVGEELDQKYLHAEYERRKKLLIPPFCKKDDDKPEEQRHGDVAIWLELLQRVEQTKKPLILVTDDKKDNWWLAEGGGHKQPHPLLVREMHTKTGQDVLFYSSERFSQSAPARLGIEIPSQLAEETKSIRENSRNIVSDNIAHEEKANVTTFRGINPGFFSIEDIHELAAKLIQYNGHIGKYYSSRPSKLRELLLSLLEQRFINSTSKFNDIESQVLQSMTVGGYYIK